MADKANIKAEARKLIERLPETATWDDLAYEIYVRQGHRPATRRTDAFP